jgi:site-specific DNA-methyltransferase (adenine-specific)
VRIEHIGDATLYLGDCLEILPTLDRVDCVLTDPPYGMNLDTDFSGMKSRLGGYKGKMQGNTYDRIKNDDKFRFWDYWSHLCNVQTHVWFGADYYMPLDISRQGSLSIWDKRLADSADKMFGSCFETIWHKPARKRNIYRYKWAGIFGMEHEVDRCRIHPTQKPQYMMDTLLSESTDAGQTALDPFMGSGTTGVACANLGRRFVGIEINEKYFNIACERITAAYAQGRLFA